MSFKENAYQQMSFTDSFSELTAREQKALEKSWAKVFADEIFPAIDEKRFSVLYSDKAVSYTHLDVYKRQVYNGLTVQFCRRNRSSIIIYAGAINSKQSGTCFDRELFSLQKVSD